MRERERERERELSSSNQLLRAQIERVHELQGKAEAKKTFLKRKISNFIRSIFGVFESIIERYHVSDQRSFKGRVW